LNKILEIWIKEVNFKIKCNSPLNFFKLWNHINPFDDQIQTKKLKEKKNRRRKHTHYHRGLWLLTTCGGEKPSKIKIKILMKKERNKIWLELRELWCGWDFCATKNKSESFERQIEKHRWFSTYIRHNKMTTMMFLQSLFCLPNYPHTVHTTFVI
jgi:hypothetical protein